MGKKVFNSNLENYQVVGCAAMEPDKAFGYVEARFPIGSMVLPFGDAVDVKWNGITYPAIKIYTFDAYGLPENEDLMSLSTVSYKHYGIADKEHPTMQAPFRVSQKGYNVPDAELISGNNPFNFSLSGTGRMSSDSGKELMKISANKIQVAKVIAYQYVFVADYGDDHNVVLVDETDADGRPVKDPSTGFARQVCKMKRRRKPVFELVPIDELPETMKTLVKSALIQNHFKK